MRFAVIPNTFFITGLGRSGTKFLATVLGRSRQYKVVHEWHNLFYRDQTLNRFPFWRFYLARKPFGKLRNGYGEVNSYLRHTLRANAIGREACIEKRAIIFRDPKDVAISAMNRRANEGVPFETVVQRILTSYANLLALKNGALLKYDTFLFHRFTTDLEYLRQLINWTGITDVNVATSDLSTKVNANKASSFPHWSDWDDSYWQAYSRIELDILGFRSEGNPLPGLDSSY